MKPRMTVQPLDTPLRPSCSLSSGPVSSFHTPMHRSITLNQTDNLIWRGNWHHLLLVGLAGDWQMIGAVSCVVGAISLHDDTSLQETQNRHPALFMSANHSMEKTHLAEWIFSNIKQEKSLFEDLSFFLNFYFHRFYVCVWLSFASNSHLEPFFLFVSLFFPPFVLALSPKPFN